MICEVSVEGISYVAWTVFLFFVAYAAGIRINLRDRYKIDGNMVEDFFAGWLSNAQKLVSLKCILRLVIGRENRCRKMICYCR